MLQILRFFLRPKCVICGDDTRLGLHWCMPCVRSLFQLRELDRPALISYRGRAAASLLSEIRSPHHRHAVCFFGKILAKHALPETFDFVLSAPQNRQNSALSNIAQKLASLTTAQYLPDYFSKPTRHRQHGRNAEDRLDSKLFLASQRIPRMAGARVLLLDDVSTTGTTLSQCVFLLREQGVKSITPFVLACSPAKFKGESEEANKKT